VSWGQADRDRFATMTSQYVRTETLRQARRSRTVRLGLSILTTAIVAAGCTTGGSTQSAKPISTAYPSFGPPDGIGTCADWFTLTPSQRAGILPWLYATLIQSEQDVPKPPYPREKYILKLTKSDISRGVAIIDTRCKSEPNIDFAEVAFHDFPPSLPPGIYSPSPSAANSHPSTDNPSP
jgi:hypothetical protein